MSYKTGGEQTHRFEIRGLNITGIPQDALSISKPTVLCEIIGADSSKIESFSSITSGIPSRYQMREEKKDQLFEWEPSGWLVKTCPKNSHLAVTVHIEYRHGEKTVQESAKISFQIDNPESSFGEGTVMYKGNAVFTSTTHDGVLVVHLLGKVL
ncbi:hypothetical protein BD410DRAFT_790273 [Rickenella mellea]|uniref:Uncharacterized protein n=1 Tax=Rickenella mellea TaxID=50990 RepID=A0A4Y7PZV2_9AGAM|nr:hypothetical protein BD410DRAFT_790273 [Rickenella mellea]